jgi:hypothetical protein
LHFLTSSDLSPKPIFKHHMRVRKNMMVETKLNTYNRKDNYFT